MPDKEKRLPQESIPPALERSLEIVRPILDAIEVMVRTESGTRPAMEQIAFEQQLLDMTRPVDAEIIANFALLELAVRIAEAPKSEGAPKALEFARKLVPDVVPESPDPDLGLRIWSALRKANIGFMPLSDLGKARDFLVRLITAVVRDDPALKPYPETPNPFTSPMVAFASGAPAFGALQAILQKGGWQPDEDGFPRFVTTFKGKKMQAELAYHIILPYNPSDEAVLLVQKDLAYEILRDMGPDTAWLHMLLLAYSAKTEEGEKCVIPRQAVYKALGLDHRADLTRWEKDKRAQEEIRRLQSLGLSILRLQIEGKDIRYERRRGYLWYLAIRDYGQAQIVEIDGKFVQRFEDWQLVATPGDWAGLTLYGNPLRQIGWLARDMFEKIDRRKGGWPVALAVLLTFKTRFAPDDPIAVTNRQIIEFAGGEVYPADRRKRHEIKMRVLNAIEEQTKWGWKVDFSDWPEDLRPDAGIDEADDILDGDGSEASPKQSPRNYWDAFLQAKTLFTPPRDMLLSNMAASGLVASFVAPELPAPRDNSAPKANRRKRTSAKTKTENKVNTFTASDLQALRSRLNWSQQELANYLGVSQKMVSLMENGKRRISQETQKKLVALSKRI